MTGISVTSPPTTNPSTSNGTNRTNTQPPRNSKDATPAQRYSELKLAPEKYSIIQLGIAMYFYHHDTPENVKSITTTSTTSSATNEYSPRPFNKTVNEVTQLPASPLRSSSRGYTDAATPNKPVLKTPPVVSSYDVKTHLPPGTTYSVRRYNFYMFPDATTSTALQQLPRDIVMNVSTIAFLLEHKMSFDMLTRYGIPYATSCRQAQSYLKAYMETSKKNKKKY